MPVMFATFRRPTRKSLRALLAAYWRRWAASTSVSRDVSKPNRGLSRLFDLPDALEFLAYAELGSALFVGINYAIGRAIWHVGSPLLTIAYLCLVLGTLGQCLYDLFKRRFSLASYVLVGAWALCIAAVMLTE